MGKMQLCATKVETAKIWKHMEKSFPEHQDLNALNSKLLSEVSKIMGDIGNFKSEMISK